MLSCRLSQLDQLKVLVISGNPALGAVPEVVYNLTQLTKLDMSYCGITEISDRYVRVSYTVRWYTYISSWLFVLFISAESKQ